MQSYKVITGIILDTDTLVIDTSITKKLNIKTLELEASFNSSHLKSYTGQLYHFWSFPKYIVRTKVLTSDSGSVFVTNLACTWFLQVAAEQSDASCVTTEPAITADNN